MENDFDEYMYANNEDDVQPLIPKSEIKLDIIKSALSTEITIDGKKFEVVNPIYVRDLHNRLSKMHGELESSKHEIKQLSYKLRQYESQIQNLKRMLDNKIDRQ